MRKSITTGNSNFEELILHHAIYVDKSDFLPQLVSNEDNTAYIAMQPIHTQKYYEQFTHQGLPIAGNQFQQ